MLSSPLYSIVSLALKWANYFAIGATEPPAREGLSPARTSLVDGMQLDKGPVHPRDVTSGRAVGLGHLVPFPGYTFSSNQRIPQIPCFHCHLLSVQTALPHCSIPPSYTKSHLLPCPAAILIPAVPEYRLSLHSSVFFLSFSSLFPFFLIGFVSFQHSLHRKKIFLLLNRICEMCCAYSSFALTTPRFA